MEFRAAVEETGLSYSEDPMIVALVVWHDTSVRQTVRRTESIIANTALCIASYTGAL